MEETSLGRQTGDLVPYKFEKAMDGKAEKKGKRKAKRPENFDGSTRSNASQETVLAPVLEKQAQLTMALSDICARLDKLESKMLGDPSFPDVSKVVFSKHVPTEPEGVVLEDEVPVQECQQRFDAQEIAPLPAAKHQTETMALRSPGAASSIASSSAAGIHVEECKQIAGSVYTYLLHKISTASTWQDDVYHCALCVTFTFAHFILAYAFLDGGVLSFELASQVWIDEPPYKFFFPESAKIAGEPILNWLCGITSVALMALTMYNDTAQCLSFSVGRPCGKMSFRVISLIVQVVRTAVIPMYVALGAIVLLASSANTLELVMNSVAANFLFEVDDVVYNVIPSKDRETYEESMHNAWLMKADGSMRMYKKMIKMFDNIVAIITAVEAAGLTLGFICLRLTTPIVSLNVSTIMTWGALWSVVPRIIGTKIINKRHTEPDNHHEKAKMATAFIADLLFQALIITAVMVCKEYVLGHAGKLDSQEYRCALNCLGSMQTKTDYCAHLWGPDYNWVPTTRDDWCTAGSREDVD